MSTKKQAKATEKKTHAKSPQHGDLTKKSTSDPLFVIHKHQGRSLHYDLRLEDEGVLKSWAIPKGPSTDPADKQLAIQTEDHPLDYARFEGNIPTGSYGAGPVIVWDTGTFKNLKKNKSLTQSLHDGEATIWLNGKKLQGGYALIKTHYEDKDTSWLLIKMNDEKADRTKDITKEQPNSVLSGESLEEIS